MTAFCRFDTSLGNCAIVWTDAGILGTQLPDGGDRTTETAVIRRFPAAVHVDPSPEIRLAIGAIRALLSGEASDLARLQLDKTGLGDFDRSVYEVARSIPPGRTMTYGEIARRLGDPNAARAVGRSLGANPWPIIVPCHRVLGADGKVGGFSAPGGVVTKIRMLDIEKARTDDRPALFEDLPLAIKPRR